MVEIEDILSPIYPIFLSACQFSCINHFSFFLANGEKNRKKRIGISTTKLFIGTIVKLSMFSFNLLTRQKSLFHRPLSKHKPLSTLFRSTCKKKITKTSFEPSIASCCIFSLLFSQPLLNCFPVEFTADCV